MPLLSVHPSQQRGEASRVYTGPGSHTPVAKRPGYVLGESYQRDEPHPTRGVLGVFHTPKVWYPLNLSCRITLFGFTQKLPTKCLRKFVQAQAVNRGWRDEE